MRLSHSHLSVDVFDGEFYAIVTAKVCRIDSYCLGKFGGSSSFVVYQTNCCATRVPATRVGPSVVGCIQSQGDGFCNIIGRTVYSYAPLSTLGGCIIKTNVHGGSQ